MLERKIGNTTVKVVFSEKVFNPWNESGRVHQAYVNKYTVKCKNLDTGRQISFPFYDSIHATQTMPIGYDDLMDSVLECMSMDYFSDSERFPSFEDFANEFGYDTDSRKAEKTYKAVIKLADKLQSVFTEEDVQSMGYGD